MRHERVGRADVALGGDVADGGELQARLQEVLDVMKELNRTERTTFIFSTHDAKVMANATTMARVQDDIW